jgi:hypothetical protein
MKRGCWFCVGENAHIDPSRNSPFFPPFRKKRHFERKMSGIPRPSMVVWAVVGVFLKEDVSLISLL